MRVFDFRRWIRAGDGQRRVREGEGAEGGREGGDERRATREEASKVMVRGTHLTAV